MWDRKETTASLSEIFNCQISQDYYCVYYLEVMLRLKKLRCLQVTDRSSTFLKEFLRKYHYFSTTKEKYLSEAANKSQAKRARNLINIHPEYIYTIHYIKKTVYIKMTGKQMVISQIKPYEQSFIPTKWTRCKIY